MSKNAQWPTMSVRMEELVMREWVTIFVTANWDLLEKTAPKVWLKASISIEYIGSAYSSIQNIQSISVNERQINVV